MLIVEIDALDLQPSQTSFARLPNVIRFAVDAAKSRVAGIAQNPKLGCNHDLLAMSLERTADELLICVRTVNIGGVEKSDAEVDSAMHRGQRFLVIAVAVEIRHSHATETDCRGIRAASA